MSDHADAPDDGVFDADALTPRDKKEPFRFRFGGEVFTTRDPMEFNIVALRGSMQDPAENLAAMLGEEEWDRLASLDAVFDMEHADAVAEAYFKHHGLTPGKQPGSQKPSRPRRIR